MCIKHRNGPHPDEPIGYILDALNITKDCCRTRIMTNMEFKNYYNVLDSTSLAPTRRAVATEGTIPAAVSADAKKQLDNAVAILTAASTAQSNSQGRPAVRKGKKKM